MNKRTKIVIGIVVVLVFVFGIGMFFANNKKKTPQEIQAEQYAEIQRELERLRNKPAVVIDPGHKPEPAKAKPAAEEDPFLISFNKETGERFYRIPAAEKGGTNWIQLTITRFSKGRVYWDTLPGSPVVKITCNREGGPVIYYPDPEGKSDLLNPKEPVTKIKVESTAPGIGNEFRIWHAK